jgi:hypothetical protein
MDWKLTLIVVGGLIAPGVWGWMTGHACIWLGAHRIRPPAHDPPPPSHLDYQI